MSGITEAPITSIATVTGNVEGNVVGSVGSIPSQIQSLQRGVISVSGNSSTATISSVDTSKAVVLFGGWLRGQVIAVDVIEFARLVLTNGTTVTASYGSDKTPDPEVPFQVIEYK